MLPKQSVSYKCLPLQKCFIQKVTNPLKLLINVLVLIYKKPFVFRRGRKY